MYINIIGGGVGLAAMRAAVKALGPTLFLDADLITGSDGDAIKTWPDDSGNGRNFTQSTASYKPLLKKAANGINGHNVVRFDGTDDVLASAVNASAIITASADTFWVVFKIFAITTNSSTTYYNDTAINFSQSRGLVFRTSLGAIGYVYTGVYANTNKAVSTSTPYIARSRHSGGNVYLNLNGGSEGSTSAGNVSGLSSPASLASDSTIIYTQIDIAEVIVFNSALSAENIAIVDAYLKAKYATY